MFERTRESADYSETKRLPEMNRDVIRAHDEIELHRSEATALCVAQRMLAECAADAAAAHRCRVAAIRDVRAAALLVRAKKVGSANRTAFVRNEHLMVAGEPVSKRIEPLHRSWQRIGRALTDDRFENAPDAVLVGAGGGPNVHS